MAWLGPCLPKRPRRARRGERGFSLIELMLAMTVFEIGALGLLALIYSSAQGVTSSRYVTHATLLATSKLNELMQQPYDHAELAVGAHEETLNIDSAGALQTGHTFNANDGLFARSWTVATPVSGVGFKSIVVRVRWWDLNYKREGAIEVRGGRSEQ